MSAVAGPIDVERLRREIESGAITTVVCATPDLWGRLVGKRVTGATFLKEGLVGDLHASLYLFVVDMDMDPREGYALTGWDDGFRDCRLVPDLETIRVVPWLERTAIVICDPMEAERDELVPLSPRALLRRQIDRYAERGLRLKCATELEFYLYLEDYRSAWDGGYRDLKPLSYYHADYHILQSSRDDWLIADLRDQMDEAGIEIEFSKAEWGLGQQEVNMRYCDILEMADRHLIYKNGVKEIAAKAGLSASFMAKPAIDDVGSSCHVHVSAWDSAGKQALFDHEGGDGDPLLDFIAGQVAHGPELSVFFAPNINSYKRFLPNQFSGTNFAWGLDNRTCGLRVVGERASRRLEHRIPGADANPYLALAAIAAAGLAGLDGDLECPPPVARNAAEDTAAPSLPPTLDAALRCFETGALGREAFGSEAFDHLCNFFRQEVDAFNRETVTDWERRRYFERV